MLTDTKIKAAKPREKPYKLSDGRGLYLLVDPSGGRWWRLKYRFRGKEKKLSLGVYPDVGLKLAREKRDEERRVLGAGVDPAAARREKRAQGEDTFRALATEWLARQKLAPATEDKAKWQFDDHLFPELGDKPVREIDAPTLLSVLRKIEARGAIESAHRAKQRFSQVLRYAIATGRADSDPSRDLKDALTALKPQNRAAVTQPTKVGELLRAIDGYSGHPVTRAALCLAPYVFVRPGELRGAQWSEINLHDGEWRIRAERMKMGEEHIVPLAPQAVVILRDIHLLTGTGKYVFPAITTPKRCISENTITAALRRMGYSGQEMTAHGFRAMASTLLNEQGFPPDVIELQLAHKERNKVRAAYNRAQRLSERRKMMRTWADYLDALKAGGDNVVALRKKAASQA
jgi:integrase